MQKIKLNIGNRVYPLSVDINQEEILRKAAKQINQMINDYESKYAVRDKQDSLAMCALQILSQSKTFSNDDDKEALEIGEKLNKSVLYEVKGNEISMNKDSFHILQDAFVHVLRNSIDHGIETPEERVQGGKSSKGKIEVICFDESDDELKIIIRDDGRGIDLEKIAEKAASLGLVSTSKLESMSREEIFDIIFESRTYSNNPLISTYTLLVQRAACYSPSAEHHRLIIPSSNAGSSAKTPNLI